MARMNIIRSKMPPAEARIQKALRTGATILDLRDLNLTGLPDSIGQLAQLQQLYLYNNQLTVLPEFISQLTQLQQLELGNNQLTMLPESIGQLIQLQQLELGCNQLKVLPDSIGQLTQLQKFYLYNNQLKVLPDSIGQLSKLQTFDLSNNKLTALSESIGQLTQLQELDLSGNKFTELPESIGQLTKLQRLSFSSNQLTELPESIGQLPKLQRLDLSGNQLAKLPESLRKLTALRSLFLHGNDALSLPPEILGSTNTELFFENKKPAEPFKILDYYFRVRVAKRPLNEAKLILVGRGGVGKTSLVNRLLYSRFNSKEKKTEGICISEWELKLRRLETVRLNLWDFGGQEIMHATHQFFLTQRSLYLLVLEGRQGSEDADAEYWLKLIESFGSESSDDLSPVIVVLNKIKANPFDLNRRALQQKYPFICGFVATDCEDCFGIKELGEFIKRETDQLKHLRVPFPASWFSIKDKLAGMNKTLKKNYVSFDEYRSICNENGENDPKAQESLAFYMHSLGIALNYKDDPRLNDMHVLNPRWLTNGIYKILNSPLLAKQKGELRLKDAARILDPADYPRQMHRFLFDLMKKFDLCFNFPDDDSHYLIPDLLDKQEPVEAGEFLPVKCLNFEYRYPVLPEGLLPRFIVRTHALSEGMPRWRTGVVLEFEGNRAFVKADVQDKRVFIAVSGPTVGRRRLLAVIRSDLERIHNEISKLKPEELVPVPGRPKLAIRYSKLLALESKGKRTFDEELQGDIVDLDVQELLSGVDLEGVRQREAAKENDIRVFYSYSHKDELLKNKLETHLKLLQRTGLISLWHDRKIEAGDDWMEQIDENLERANIILLLVSADFIASDYSYEKEMGRALERHKSGEATVIPVIVRDVNWRRAPFAKLQALPKDGKAVMEWSSKDAAWRNVSEGIERVVEKIRKGRR